VEDVTSATWLSAFNNWDGFNEYFTVGSSRLPWLKTILLRVYLRQKKRYLKGKEVTDLYSEYCAKKESPPDTHCAHDWEYTELVARELLTEFEYRVFKLHIGGVTDTKIAKTLGVSRQWIGFSRQKLMRKIRLHHDGGC